MPNYGNIGDAGIRILADGSQFGPSLSKAAEPGVRAAGSRMASTLVGTLKAGAVAAGAVVSGVLGVALTKGFQRLVALDQAKVKMNTLGLSAKGVAQAMDTVKAAVKGTAYGLDEGATLATQFMAAGVKGGKQLFTQLRDVAGAAAITGGSMGEIGMIWTQVAAKGRLQGDEMLQLMQRGIPVLQLLAKHYKVSTAEASKMVSKGKVDFADFSAAMHTYVGSAAEDSGKTFSGAMANLKAALGRIGQGLLESTFTQLAPTFQKIIKTLAPLEDDAAKIGKRIGEAFARGVKTVESWLPTIKKVGDAFSGLFALITKGDYTGKLRTSLGLQEDSPLISAVLTIRDRIVGAFTSIKERLAGLGNLLPPDIAKSLPVWAGLAGTVLGVGGAFSGVSGILGRFLPMLGPLSAGLGPLSGILGGLGGVLKNVLLGPLGIVVGIFAGMYATSQPFRDALKDMLPPLKDLVEDLRDAFMPVIEDLARDLMPAIVSAADAFAPVLSDIAKAIGPLVDTLLPPFAALLDAAADSVAWLANLLGPFTPVLAGLALAIWGVNAALGATSGLMTAFSMSLVAHPIGWLIGALALLVLAFKALWDNVEGFRNFFIGIWNAIKTAAAAAVNWFQTSFVPFFQTVWGGIQTGLEWLGNLFSTVWGGIQTAVQTVANAISTAVNWLWTTIIQPVFNAMVAFFNSVVMPIWNTLSAIAVAAFQMIEIAGLALWKFVLKPVFDAIVAGLQWLGAAFTWLNDNVIQPVWNGIKATISAVWNWINLNVFEPIKKVIAAVGAAFSWLNTNVIQPVWNAIRNAIATAWNWINTNIFGPIKTGIAAVGTAFTVSKDFIVGVWNTLKGLLKAGWDFISTYVFDPVKKGVDLVKSAFDTAVKGISKVWDGLKAIAQAPIRFIIETVLNKGIIAGFNWLSEKVGGPHIKDIPLPFAKGGVLPGFTPGKDIHRFYSPTGGALDLSGGEAIMRPEFTRAMGGRRGIKALNDWAVRGFAKGGVLGSGSFGTGGSLLDWIKEKAASAWDWVSDKASAIYQAITNPGDFLKRTVESLLNKLPGAGKTIAEYGIAAVNKGISAVVEKVKSLWNSFTSAFAASGVAGGGTVWPVGSAPITAPYGRYPTSGLPHRGIDFGVPTGTLVKAFRAGRISASGWSSTGFGNQVRIDHGKGYVSIYGHNRNLLRRIGEAVTAGTGIAYSDNTGHSFGPHLHFEIRKNGISIDPMPYLRGQAFDQGGLLRPGLTMAWNGTGRDERVIPGDGSYGPMTVFVNVSVDDLAKMTKIGDFIEMLERARVDARRTLRSGTVTA